MLNAHRSQEFEFQKHKYLFKKARHPLVAHGFQFTGYHRGKSNISIKAVRYSIEKKKFGHFTSGTLRVARFKGATIDVQTKPINSPEKSAADSQKSPYSLEGTFTRESMPASGMKNLVAYIFEPVRIKFLNGQSLITRIQADRATIESGDRRVVLRGNVIAATDTRKLATEKLTLVPDTGILEGDARFVLIQSEKQYRGKKIKADLSLNIISAQGFEK